MLFLTDVRSVKANDQVQFESGSSCSRFSDPPSGSGSGVTPTAASNGNKLNAEFTNTFIPFWYKITPNKKALLQDQIVLLKPHQTFVSRT